MRRAIGASVVGFFVLLVAVGTSSAAIVAQESWNYGDGTPTNVVGQTGGTGWSGSWSQPTAVLTVEAMDPGTPLSYTSGDSSIVISGGNRALRISNGPGDNYIHRLDRDLASAPDASTDAEVYVSFLMRWTGGAIDSWDGAGSEFNDNQRGVAKYQKGLQFQTVPSQNVTKDYVSAPVDMVLNTTYFVVARFYVEVNANSEPGDLGSYDPSDPVYNRSMIWVNPTAGEFGTPHGTGRALSIYTDGRHLETVLSAGPRTERINGDDVVFIDEYMIGTTWNDVIPEPMTLTLLAAGAVVLLRRRR